jgi:hypothetical protein
MSLNKYSSSNAQSMINCEALKETYLATITCVWLWILSG